MRSKRLKPFLPTMIEALEGGDEPAAEAHFKSLLLARSAAIIERKLHHARRLKRHGLTPTKAGTLLNGQIPLLGPSPIGRIPVRASRESIWWLTAAMATAASISTPQLWSHASVVGGLASLLPSAVAGLPRDVFWDILVPEML